MNKKINIDELMKELFLDTPDGELIKHWYLIQSKENKEIVNKLLNVARQQGKREQHKELLAVLREWDV